METLVPGRMQEAVPGGVAVGSGAGVGEGGRSVPRGCSAEERVDGWSWDPGVTSAYQTPVGEGSPRTSIAWKRRREEEEGQVQAEVRRSPRWVEAEARRCSWSLRGSRGGLRGTGVLEMFLKEQGCDHR